MPIPQFVNVEVAATVIGVTEGRVRQMLRDGILKGKKANARAWIVDPDDLAKVAKQEQKTGRPRSGK